MPRPGLNWRKYSSSSHAFKKGRRRDGAPTHPAKESVKLKRMSSVCPSRKSGPHLSPEEREREGGRSDKQSDRITFQMNSDVAGRGVPFGCAKKKKQGLAPR